MKLKSSSFWNFKPTKTKPSFKPLFSPKFVQPVNLKSYPSRTKQEIKLTDRNPFGDKDRDKVPNIFDCKPMDRKRQGWRPDKKTGKWFWEYSPKERHKVYRKLRNAGVSSYMATRIRGMPPNAIKEIEKKGIEAITNPKIIKKLKKDFERFKKEKTIVSRELLNTRRAYDKLYMQRPEVKKRRREFRREQYKNNPDFREKALEIARIYSKKPEAIKRRKEYENSAKRKEFKKEYAKLPHVKQRKREYDVVKSIKKMIPDLEFDEEYKKERGDRIKNIKKNRDVNVKSLNYIVKNPPSVRVDDAKKFVNDKIKSGENVVLYRGYTTSYTMNKAGRLIKNKDGATSPRRGIFWTPQLDIASKYGEADLEQMREGGVVATIIPNKKLKSITHLKEEIPLYKLKGISTLKQNLLADEGVEFLIPPKILGRTKSISSKNICKEYDEYNNSIQSSSAQDFINEAGYEKDIKEVEKQSKKENKAMKEIQEMAPGLEHEQFASSHESIDDVMEREKPDKTDYNSSAQKLIDEA